MRILQLASYGNPAAGSFVPMIAALSERVRARGDAFALVVPDVAGAAWHDALRASGTELHVVAGAREAASLARAWRPDVAHVHFFGWEPAVTLALAASRTRLFWHAHSTSVVRGRVRRTLRSLVKYRGVGARVERFVSVSAAIAGELAQLGAPPRRIVVVRNEVDARRFRAPAPAEREAARAALGLDGPTILFFGRDPYIKGADVLAQALARTAGVTVLAVGTPPAAREALAAAARVVAVERADDVVPLLWAADALAVPSRAEGFALVLLEAASTGLPAVASDLPALREAANGAAAVTFAPAEDAAALGDALRAALGSARLVSEPAPRAAGEDGPERWARNVMALYDRE